MTFVWLSTRTLSCPPFIHWIGAATGGDATLAVVVAGSASESGMLAGSSGATVGAGSSFALANDTAPADAGPGVASASSGASVCGAAPARDKFEVSAIVAAASSCTSSPSSSSSSAGLEYLAEFRRGPLPIILVAQTLKITVIFFLRQ